MKTSLFRKRKALLLAVAGFALAATPAIAKDVVVHAGKLFDGTSTSFRNNVSIVIKDDRITAVQNGFVTPAGAEVIDLRTSTVLPGFIDMHNHITGGGSRRDLITFVKDRAGHDRRYAIDCSRIERELGWKRQESFETGLEKTVDWYLANEWWWRPIRDKRYAGERLGQVG